MVEAYPLRGYGYERQGAGRGRTGAGGKEVDVVDIAERDALMAVDIQVDFLEGGALGVEGGSRVVPIVNRLVPLFAHVVFTRDWHPPGHTSFAESPAYQDRSWPAHCLQDTPGAAFSPKLRIPAHAYVVSKGTHREREEYSAFQAEEADLTGWLRARGVERVFLAGLATDYCVHFTALDAAREGFQVYVIEDAVRGVATETVEEAWREMETAGVRRVRSEQLDGSAGAGNDGRPATVD